MTKDEIIAKKDELTKWIVEEQRIYNEKMAILDTEKEKFPEDRLPTKDVETMLVEAEKPVVVAEPIKEPITEVL